jgi:thiol-disulfide isomerase/thioredoxin
VIRPVAAAAFAVGMLVVATGCAPEPEVTFNQPERAATASSSVPADKLDRLRRDSGIADCPQPRREPDPHSELPDIALPCLGDGPSVHLGQIAGRPTVINAWASWCGPCRKELPFLAQAAHEFDGRVDFLGVNVADPDAEAALAMVRQTGATYPHVVDLRSKTRVPLAYSGGLPSTVFIDAQGRMVGEERTWFRSYADVTAAIRRHLGVAP